MRELTVKEINCVGGTWKWSSVFIALAGGFISAGPAGVGIVIGLFVAKKGMDNLEYLSETGHAPTVQQMLSGG